MQNLGNSMSEIYAVIENGVVVNTVVADADIAAQHGWVSLTGEAGIGDIYEAGAFRKPPIDLAVLAANMRIERNTLLAATDWTQATDIPQATKDKWAPYRQALRDVPQQEGFPDNIVWPTPPQ